MNGALLILKKDCNIMKNSNFKLSSTLSISCFCAVINLVNASTGAEDDRGNIKFHQRNTVAEANRTSDNNRKIPPLDFNKLSLVGLGHLIMDSLFNAMINGGYKSTKEIEKCDEFGNIVLKSRSYTNFQFGNIKNNTKEKGHQSNSVFIIEHLKRIEESSNKGTTLDEGEGYWAIDKIGLVSLMGSTLGGVSFILKHARR